jgi:hypothetical protein
MDELELRRALRDMRREREPRRELWPGIAAAIATGGTARGTARRPAWLPLAMAASIVAALVLLWPATVDQRPGEIVAEAPAEPSPAPGIEARALLRQADSMSVEFRVVLAQLADAPLPPELRAIARELRDSEQLLREALRQQPESRYLLGQLRRNYEQQLRLSQLAALG